MLFGLDSVAHTGNAIFWQRHRIKTAEENAWKLQSTWGTEEEFGNIVSTALSLSCNVSY